MNQLPGAVHCGSTRSSTLPWMAVDTIRLGQQRQTGATGSGLQLHADIVRCKAGLELHTFTPPLHVSQNLCGEPLEHVAHAAVGAERR